MLKRTVAAAITLVGIWWPTLGSAQPQGGPASTGPRCAFTRQGHPNYVVWVCDAEGTAIVKDATILYSRRSQTGIEIVSPVWSGPLAEVASRADELIAAHEHSHARCGYYFHLARAERHVPSWNTGSGAMTEWWSREGSAMFPSVCYTNEPSEAKVVMVWASRSDRLPLAFSVELPRRIGGQISAADDADAPGARVAALGMYAVQPGFDGEVARLGLPLFTTNQQEPANLADSGQVLLAALRFLVASNQ